MFVNSSDNTYYVNKSNKQAKQFNNRIIVQNQLNLIDKYKKCNWNQYENRRYVLWVWYSIL